MAAVFLHANDEANYARVCQMAYSGVQVDTRDQVATLALRLEALPNGLKDLASTLAPDWALPFSSNDSIHHRQLLELGMVRYRENRYQEAKRALEFAVQSENLNRSALANIYLAMTASHLPEPENAHTCLTKAEQGWKTILEGGGGQLFPYWHEQAVIDLTLNEAKALIQPE